MCLFIYLFINFLISKLFCFSPIGQHDWLWGMLKIFYVFTKRLFFNNKNLTGERERERGCISPGESNSGQGICDGGSCNLCNNT